jgi:hypothetical protein
MGYDCGGILFSDGSRDARVWWVWRLYGTNHSLSDELGTAGLLVLVGLFARCMFSRC